MSFLTIPSFRCAPSAIASTSKVALGPSTCRTFASSSRALASGATKTSPKKKKKVVINPDAMPLAQAAELLKAVEATRSFSAYEIEIVTRFEKSAPPLRGRVALPRDARKAGGEEVILVFAEGSEAERARGSGANYVGGAELIPQILSGDISPTKVLSTPSVLPTLKPIARYLGQKGLMPTSKRGTVREDLETAISEARGLVDWKGDKQGHVRAAIGRIGFPVEDLERNIRWFVKAVKEGSAGSGADNVAAKKSSSIIRVSLGSTMGPSIELNDVSA